jgi:hypothetical protein
VCLAWKSALSGIFEDLKSSLMNTVNDILSNVIGRLMQGFSNALSGAGSFGSSFAGLMGGVGGGVGPAMGVANGVSAATGVSGSAVGASVGIGAALGTAAAVAAAPVAAGLLTKMGMMEVQAIMETGWLGEKSFAEYTWQDLHPNDPYGYQNSGMDQADLENQIANERMAQGLTFETPGPGWTPAPNAATGGIVMPRSGGTLALPHPHRRGGRGAE